MESQFKGFINADCMDMLPKIPDKYFDLAIVDPPYGINVNHNMGRRKGDKPSDYKKVDWDSSIPDVEYFEQLKRVSKNQIIWGANYFEMPPCKGFIVWRKPQISEKLSFSMCEYAWSSFDKSAKYIELFSSEKGRIHPTQKPVALYTWLLNNYAKKGDKILDTHVGSASSLIACEKLGFEYFGIEKDKEYFEKAKERIDEFKNQISFFDME